MKVTFTIVSSFEEEEDFGTDPFSYYVESNGIILKCFGDDYHDKGRAKCHAWIDGYTTGKEIVDYEIKYEERVDADER